YTIIYVHFYIDIYRQYTVDREYFISRVLKLKNNLKKKYEINQKAIAKLYRKHNTSDRLKRYLEFGRR
ncbi:hypothetical protein KSC21_13060, partial [Staphylococcus aureus]|nr:hypothetical protein [Staphylococcus aureus]